MQKTLILSLLFAAVNAASLHKAPTSVPFSYNKPLYPEGITFASRTNAFVAGSLVSGDILAIPRHGGRAKTLFSNPDIGGTVGVHVGASGKVLHTAVYKTDDFVGYTRYDLRTGDRSFVNMNFLFGYPSMSPRGHGLNDLTDDGKGNVYLTDTFGNLLVKIDKDGLGNATVLAGADGAFNITTTPPLSEFSADFGINGITYVDSCDVILTGTFGTGELFTVTPTGTVKRVSTPRQVSIDGLSLLTDATAVSTSAVGGSHAVFWKTADCWKTAEIVKTVDLSAAGYGREDPGVATNVVVHGRVTVLGAYITEFNAAQGNGTRKDYMLVEL